MDVDYLRVAGKFDIAIERRVNQLSTYREGPCLILNLKFYKAASN